MCILNASKIIKKYGDNIALDNISLSIDTGEIFGLLGPNGAGKTTFINLITGLLKEDSGTLDVFNYNHRTSTNLIKQNLGIVPQDIAIYDDLTAYENIEFFAKLYGLKGKVLANSVLESLDFVGLTDKAQGYPKNFSGGMRRRLNIACAITHKPKLIIMDEPTVGIDPQSRNHILESVKRLNEYGCTIIYTSHYMEEVELVCSRIGIIDNGKLIALGTQEELISLISDTNKLVIAVDSIDKVDLDTLGKINGVINVQISNDNVIINVLKESSNLDKIILYFTKNSISILNINSHDLNLEEVFLSLTGRSLRD